MTEPGSPPRGDETSSGADPVRARARVRGLVQGVYYRASTVEAAERLGVTGWVRNCPDGSVELEAEGATAAVEGLLAWCWTGPAGARVVGVDVEWVAATGSDASFRVKR